MDDEDKLAQEIYVRRVLKDEASFEFQGGKDHAEKLAKDSYLLADAFVAVKKRHDRGERFSDEESPTRPAKTPPPRRTKANWRTA